MPRYAALFVKRCGITIHKAPAVQPMDAENQRLFSTFDTYWLKCKPRLYQLDATSEVKRHDYRFNN
jgi:hypothetical protein